MKQSENEQFLRGIASQAKERTVNITALETALYKVAFDAVCNPQDWKLPVNALVTIHENDDVSLGVYLKAIEFFTGTKPLTLLAKDERDQYGKQVTTFRLVAAGYYLQD